MKFSGRENELTSLESIKKLRKASLVVITGRRRIGKSALVQHFAKSFSSFYEFQGLAPRTGINNDTQLKNFAEQIKFLFQGAESIFHNWTEAFNQLAKELNEKPALVFLDELSWMGKYDPDFPGKLKIAWDTKLSKIPGLILVLCGSVSSWIEENILKSTDFVGRISLTIRLEELDLKNSLNFWGSKSNQISIIERLSYLCVTGCVPKYLEEYEPTQSTSANIKRLCFSKGGYLLDDFEKIFSDIFGKKTPSYHQIVRQIINQHLGPKELATKLKISASGDLTHNLRDLELSGFISRDYFYKPGGNQGKLSKFRIKDNYLRFYLKYLESNKDKINNGLYNFSGLQDLVAWDTIIGLQFENLILNHLSEIVTLLDLKNEKILSAGPYFQTKTNKSRACQVDLLIECKSSSFYICEIKFKKQITTKVISEMQQKLEILKFPKYSSRRPVLIYAGELDQEVKDSDFFDKIINISNL